MSEGSWAGTLRAPETSVWCVLSPAACPAPGQRPRTGAAQFPVVEGLTDGRARRTGPTGAGEEGAGTLRPGGREPSGARGSVSGPSSSRVKAPRPRGKARRARPTQAPQQRACPRGSPGTRWSAAASGGRRQRPGRGRGPPANLKGREPRPGAGRCGRGQTQALGSVTHRGQIISPLETHGVQR